jgi:hypothetical protein
MIDIDIEIINNEIGKNNFHLNFINISYRNRGYVPRTHKNIIVIIIINKLDKNNCGHL